MTPSEIRSIYDSCCEEYSDKTSYFDENGDVYTVHIALVNQIPVYHLLWDNGDTVIIAPDSYTEQVQ